MAHQFHIGTFLLFAALALLVITTVSAPIWNKVGFLNVHLTNSSTVTFGTFGYCIRGASGGEDVCSGRSVGYDIANIVTNLDGTSFSRRTADNLNNINRALILHPIAAGISGFAFLIALAAHRIGFLFSSLIAFLAFIATLVALVIDFVEFAIVKHHINGSDGTGSRANYAPAIWLVVAALITLFLGSITVCFGCITDRRRRARY